MRLRRFRHGLQVFKHGSPKLNVVAVISPFRLPICQGTDLVDIELVVGHLELEFNVVSQHIESLANTWYNWRQVAGRVTAGFGDCTPAGCPAGPSCA